MSEESVSKADTIRPVVRNIVKPEKCESPDGEKLRELRKVGISPVRLSKTDFAKNECDVARLELRARPFEHRNFKTLRVNFEKVDCRYRMAAAVAIDGVDPDRFRLRIGGGVHQVIAQGIQFCGAVEQTNRLFTLACAKCELFGPCPGVTPDIRCEYRKRFADGLERIDFCLREVPSKRAVCLAVIRSDVENCFHMAMARSPCDIDFQIGADGQVAGSINPVARQIIYQPLEGVPVHL